MRKLRQRVAASGRVFPLTGDASTAELRIEQLSHQWSSGANALDRCDLTIPRPGLWMLVGSNGSGKSTLFRLIAGLLQPQTGSIETPHRAALVFQNPDHQLLLPSTGSDLMLGMPQDQTAEQRWTRMAELLDDLGLTGLDRRPIHTLSGGQKQRLAIAGALASNAGLLLLDEPTALLDPDSQRTVLQTVHALCHQPKKPLTALWITHRLDELRFADGAAQMSAGRIGPWSSGPSLLKHLRGGTPAR